MRKKRQLSQQCHLVLLGPTSVKAAGKMMVKLTPGYGSHPIIKYLKFVGNSKKRIKT